MIRLVYILVTVLLTLCQCVFAQQKTTVESFDKVMISPHIQVSFVEGNEESVTILEQKVTDDKIKIKASNGKLRVYLDGAKETTKQVKVKENGVKVKRPLYRGKQLSILVTYKTLNEISVRGEEAARFESRIKAEDFQVTIYGESDVVFEDVKIQNFDLDIIGNSEFKIIKGKVDYLNVKVIGEAVVYLDDVKNRKSKLKAVGEAEFRVNTSELVKFSAVGEAELYYKGNPEIDKGLSLGEARIHKIQ